MDAAIQAELAELRRRAFGLHPDIDGDPAAVARLVELEQLVLTEHATSAAAPAGGEPFTADEWPSARWTSPDAPPSQVEPAEPVASTTDAEPSASAAPPRRRARARRRDGWSAAAAAAAIATAVVVATPATPSGPAGSRVTVESASSAYSLTRDPDARVLLEIPFGPWIDTSTSAEDVMWLYPTSDEIQWTVLLGEYYGWELWIAGTDDQPEKQHCILALHGQAARARCIPAALRAFSALVVTLPYQVVEADERPPGFVPGERIGFWWRADDSVTVLVAPAQLEL